MNKDVKCTIINEDIAIYEYYILDNVKTFQVEITGKSGKRYINNFETMKKAKEFCKNIM